MNVADQTAAALRSNERAIIAICLGVTCLVINDAMSKWLTDYYPPLQIVFVRSVFALPMVAVAIMVLWGPVAFRTDHIRLHALRGLMSAGAAFCFFSGLKVLPLAEAVSIGFAAPLFMTALSVPLLKQHVGWRRWMAVIVGFIGVLIIVRPGMAAFQPAALYVVAAALLYALYMLSARRLKDDESFATMSFYVVLFPLIYTAFAMPFQWQPFDTSHIPVFVALAIFGTAGVTLMAQAFRLGSAAVVAPFDYTALVWAILLGYLVWGDLPGPWTYAGSAVIIASGIYIVFRETRLGRPTTGDSTAGL